MVKEYKVLLLGSGGVGKTAYVKKLISGNFEKMYVATYGLDIYDINFETTIGDVKFNILDFAGQEMYCKDYRQGHYFDIDAVIIMVDLTSKISFSNNRYWIKEIQSFFGDRDIPYILIGNKQDCTASLKISDSLLQSECEKQNYDEVIKISTKTGLNLQKPYKSINQKIKNNNEIEIM